MTESINGNKLIYTIKSGDNLTKISKQYNTNIDTILKLNPQIRDKDLIYTGKQLILDNNEKFVQREDYSPNNLNIGSIKINGDNTEQINGQNIKSNFYANNLSSLSTTTLNDDNSASKIVVEMQAGKSMTRKDNDTPYSILNKVLGDHIDNNSTIIKDENGKLHTKQQYLEKTDLYNYFISEDVNGDNFTGENNKLLPRGESANNVQIPAVEADKNGVKYFTLHGNNEIFYFDSKGKKVSYENGSIIGAQNTNTKQEAPKIDFDNNTPIQQPSVTSFEPHKDYNDKVLNTGKIFINGKEIQENNLKSNYYQNNVNIYTEQTLNDQNNTSRVDIQLNIGNNISKRDTSASDILKKMLANNYDKASEITKNEQGTYTANNKQLQNTDLYKAFISKEVNGNNFENNNIVKNSSNYNLVQFPALEVAENNMKYYTLQTNDGKILYFNDSGEQIQAH